MKLIVFDLDGTLAESKSAIDAEMAVLPYALLGIVKVIEAIIACLAEARPDVDYPQKVEEVG